MEENQLQIQWNLERIALIFARCGNRRTKIKKERKQKIKQYSTTKSNNKSDAHKQTNK